MELLSPSFSHLPKHRAWFSFGVKLNLTIFLLDLEILSPLHLCGAPSTEQIHAPAPRTSSASSHPITLCSDLPPCCPILTTTLLTVSSSRRDHTSLFLSHRAITRSLPSSYLDHERNLGNELHPSGPCDGHGRTPFHQLLP
jgi:hypothetical protein